MFIPDDMVLVEIVMVLLTLPNVADTLTWQLLPGLRDDMVKSVASTSTTLKLVFTKFCCESHKK